MHSSLPTQSIMKRPVTLLLLCLLALALPLPAQPEPPPIELFRIGSGGAGGTYYPIAGLIALAISNPPGSRDCSEGGSCGVPGLVAIAQAANGSVANVMDIQKGILESGFSQSDVAHWAYTASETFQGRAPMSKLRTIASLYPESIHLVARRGSGIHSVYDLQGKRVALGEPGSGTLIDAEILLRAYGLNKDQVNIEYAKFELAAEKLRSGTLDAFFVVTGYPARTISELARDSAIDLIPIDGPVSEQVIRDNPFFSRGAIPGDTYSGIADTVSTINVQAQWLTSSDLDDELIYQITRTLWNENSQQLLDKGHRKGREIRLQSALKGLAVPLHPGAARFYREQGITVGKP